MLEWIPYDYYTTTRIENHHKANAKNTILLSFEWVKLQVNLPFALSLVRLCYFFVIKPVRGKKRKSINSFVLISLHLEATGCLIRTIMYLMMAMKVQERTNLNGNLSS